MPSLRGVIVTVVTIGVLLLVTPQIIGPIVDLSGAGDPTTLTNRSANLVGGATGGLPDDGDGDVQSVKRAVDSTGYAVRFRNATDSYATTDSGLNVSGDDTWTVATWAAVNSSAIGENMTALSVDGRVLLGYNGTGATNNWTLWYYDDGSTNSYELNATASAQTDLTQLMAVRNGSNLTFYINATPQDTANVSDANVANANLNRTNWHGRLDETRAFDTALNSSQRNATADAPVAPLANATRTARIYYDRGAGTSEPVFFASTGLTLSNITWVHSGHAGQTLVEGTDYSVDLGSDRITALDGGAIEGAPAVWVTVRVAHTTATARVAGVIADGLMLAAVIVVVLVAGHVVGQPGRIGQGGRR